MNKTQIKILIKKILPISIFLIVIVGALISIPIVRYYGEEVKRENEEWYSNPKNEEKIKKILQQNQSKESGDNFYKSIQNRNVKYIKSLKIDTEGWKISSDPVGVNDETGILKMTKDEDYFTILFSHGDNFSGLEDYFENQKEKLVRNFNKVGVYLESVQKMERIVKERLALIEIFETEFNGEKQPEMVIMSMKHNGYYYTITYPTGSENVSKLFDNFSFED